jgi:uncharacterized coiled-coil protein SlyX
MILAVFFLCTGFGTSWQHTSNFRGLASAQEDGRISDLEATICNQNQTISNLESRIEELIANSEATLAAADNAEEEEQEEQEQEDRIVTHYAYSGQTGGGFDQMAMMMMMFQMISNQTSQLTQLQASMAVIQSTQTQLLNNQAHMTDYWDQAFNRQLPQYPNFTYFNFGNSPSLNNGQSTEPADRMNAAQNRLSTLNIPQQRADMFHFFAEPTPLPEQENQQQQAATLPETILI